MAEAKKTVTINDKKYDYDALSDAARAQVDNITVTEMEIRRLQTRLRIAQTARNAYAAALTQAVGAPAEKAPGQPEGQTLTLDNPGDA
jgi:hypothetical protein